VLCVINTRYGIAQEVAELVHALQVF